MAQARTHRIARQGRTGRQGRQPRVMSHRARRSRAEAPDEAVELAAGEVRRAFEEWASRFVELLVAQYVRPTFKADALAWRLDATIRGLFEEAGRARPRREKLEQAFRMLDKQSSDELRVTGVPTADVVPGAERLRQEWLRNNTELIRAEADLRRRVERILEDPLNQGRSVSDIAKLLEEQAGYSTSRAVLTARDQTLKLYGQIQQERQQNAGIDRYVWTTSLDERVRPDHAALDGTIQSWDDPPIVDQRTGRRGHPGYDFQCRCTAVPVLDEEAAQPEAQVRQTELRKRAVAEGRFSEPPPRERARAEAARLSAEADVRAFSTVPPREPVMVPTQAEIAAERARAEAERRAIVERERQEREADLRIAAAREAARAAALENVPAAIAPRTAAELVELAQEAPRAAAKRAQVEAVVDRALVGKSLEDLRAIPFTAEELASESGLNFLRQDPTFRATGNVRDNFGSSKAGLPQILIEADGVPYLSNGRHRLTVARELGLRQIIARVRRVGPRGGVLWEYVGPIRI